MDWRNFYSWETVTEALPELNLPIIQQRKNLEYYNIPAAFDIEVSSFFRTNGNGEMEKCACMYIWQFGIGDFVCYGRTWDEFRAFIGILISELHLSVERRLIVYVHNLSYEFQHIRKHLQWEKVFSMDIRKPLYALTCDGVEFRCSYLLSGYSLVNLAGTLTRHKVEKMVGDLDYNLIRHSETPLTDKELKYTENDIRVILAYITEKIEDDGNITKIPLTKTGYVRRYCRNKCLYDGNNHKKNTKKYINYRGLMKKLTLDLDEYMQLKRAFQGGFTHASAWKANKKHYNVSSYDFTSSYPAVMISERFPMSKAQYLGDMYDGPLFRDCLKRYCCLFDIEFINLNAKINWDHPLSASKCWVKEKPLEYDNGRIASAARVCTTITELDFWVFEQFYTWDSIRIKNFRRYKKGYLPKDFIQAILTLYKDKTELKGVEGREIDYAKSKEMINATYGMSVTDIVKPLIEYNSGWPESIDLVMNADQMQEEIESYNKKTTRFLYYPWGVWITAYARKNLFTGILECGKDYIYSDTDSLKITNRENHAKYFEKYNSMIKNKLIKAMEFHGLDKSLIEPTTKNGVKKPLGVWDYEGTYGIFKTLGAKRYCYSEKGNFHITMSGVNPKQAAKYLQEKYGGPEGAIDAFADGLIIPVEGCGRSVHTYIDEEIQGTVTDYLGNTGEFHELSTIHMEGTTYTMSLITYLDYLKGVQEAYE